MKSFFSTDSGLYRFISKLSQVFFLNVLWLLFSLPIVTIGASTAAACYVALRMTDNEEGYIFRDFKKGFKDNWKQGTVLFLVSAVAAYALYLDFQFFHATDSIVFLIIGIISVFICADALIFSFPLIARYKNTVPHTLQNSFEISTRNPGWTILIILLAAFEIVLFNWNTTMVFFGVCFGPMIVIYTVCGISKRIFQKIEIDQGLK